MPPVEEKRKLYVLDTNVLMTDVDDPLEDIIYKIAGYSEKNPSFPPNDIAILQVVRSELDSLKQSKPGEGSEFRSYRARRVQDAIEKMLNNYPAKKDENTEDMKSGINKMEYIALPNGSKVYFVDHNASKFEEFWKKRSGYETNTDISLAEKLPFSIEPKNDDKIVFMADYLAKEYSNYDVCLISKDKNVRTDANIGAYSFRSENLRFDFINPKEVYTGLCRRIIPGAFNESGLEILLKEKIDLTPNEFVEFSEGKDAKKYGIIKLENGERHLKPLLYASRIISSNTNSNFAESEKEQDSGFKIGNRIRKDKKFKKGPGSKMYEAPVNIHNSSHLPMSNLRLIHEQILYEELLNDPSIELVSCYGAAGSGKTLFATRAGLKQVLEGGYEKLIYVRPLEKLGDDVGYLPGAIREKIDPWIQPLVSNLSKIWEGKGANKKDIENEIKRLEGEGLLEYRPPTFLRGANLSNSFIIFDEVQTESKDTIKLILSRTGENSKMVMLGGPSQIDKNHNDQAFLLERFVHAYADLNDPFYGHITLSNNCILRSKTAMMVAKAKY